MEGFNVPLQTLLAFELLPSRHNVARLGFSFFPFWPLFFFSSFFFFLPENIKYPFRFHGILGIFQSTERTSGVEARYTGRGRERESRVGKVLIISTTIVEFQSCKQAHKEIYRSHNKSMNVLFFSSSFFFLSFFVPSFSSFFENEPRNSFVVKFDELWWRVAINFFIVCENLRKGRGAGMGKGLG